MFLNNGGSPDNIVGIALLDAYLEDGDNVTHPFDEAEAEIITDSKIPILAIASNKADPVYGFPKGIDVSDAGTSHQGLAVDQNIEGAFGDYLKFLDGVK